MAQLFLEHTLLEDLEGQFQMMNHRLLKKKVLNRYHFKGKTIQILKKFSNLVDIRKNKYGYCKVRIRLTDSKVS